MEGKPEISNILLYGIMIGMLLTGTAITLFEKIEDEVISDCNYFIHPYIQSMFQFFGEFLCFVPLGIKRLVYGHENKVNQET